MNKKVFLLATAMILCLLMVGIAFAVSYFDASPSIGTVSTDGCFLLTMSGDNADNLVLEENEPTWYKLELNMERSDDAAAQGAKGRLYVKLSPKSGKTVEGVKIEIFESQDSASSVAIIEGLSSGEADCTISDISGETKVYWLKITLSSGHTADELEKIAGDVSLVFKQQ